uniref:Uncharacterized protein n=1 Tax=Mustela putorius furo TaxID=9669 RepID=M3YCE4_MUSPF
QPRRSGPARVGAAPGRKAAQRPGAAAERGVRASPRPVPRPRRRRGRLRQLPVRPQPAPGGVPRAGDAGRAGHQSPPGLRWRTPSTNGSSGCDGHVPALELLAAFGFQIRDSGWSINTSVHECPCAAEMPPSPKLWTT